MATYPGPGRFKPVTSDPERLVAEAHVYTTPKATLHGSPQAAVDLREAHLSRRFELIRQLGYPSMKLLSVKLPGGES